MEKEIKDYLHLYLGREVIEANIDDFPATLVVVGLLGSNEQKYRILYGGMSFTKPFDFSKHKLVLRNLSDMTEVERKQYKSLGCATGTSVGDMILEAKRTQLLLLMNFDLFNLIEDGLAVDETALNTYI